MSESGGPGLWQMLRPWTSADAMNRWVERTTWWVRPQSIKSQQQMLVELLEAMAGRFLGRHLTLDVRGKRVDFTLGQVRVQTDQPTSSYNPMTWWAETPAARGMLQLTRKLAGGEVPDNPLEPSVERVQVDTSAVSIDEHVVGDVAATVDGVRLELGATSELVTGPLDLEVCATRATALEWIRRALPEWDLRLKTDGLIAGRYREWRWPITLVGRPAVVDTQTVRVDVVAIELLKRTVRLPRRLVRHRTFDLPAPSPELELTDLQLEDDVVRVRLRHAGVRQPVRPEHLRAAIREGLTSFGAAVFGGS
jgi:hypothetical protein